MIIKVKNHEYEYMALMVKTSTHAKIKSLIKKRGLGESADEIISYLIK